MATKKIQDGFRFPLTFIVPAGLLVLGTCALLIRWVFIHYQSVDYTSFIYPWYTILQNEGFGAFARDFSNYNFPYLYLLYFVSLLPIPAIVGIKLLSIGFDFVLAFSVYLVVKTLNGSKSLALTAASICLFVPTVIMNSAAWGQCDAIFTSMLVFSFYFLLKKRFNFMWLFWGIAFAFKLQAVFVLPVYIVGWVISKKSQKWYAPLFGIIPFIVAVLPPLFAGRSLQSTLSVYLNQQGTYQHLTLNAANLYQWLNDSLYPLFNKAGLLFAFAAIAGLMLLVITRLRKQALTPTGWLLFITLISVLVPFVLPQMHERYFYPAVIFSLILAFQSLKFGWVFIALELTSIFSSIPFLFDIPTPIPLPLLAFVHLAVIITLGCLLHSRGFENKQIIKGSYV